MQVYKFGGASVKDAEAVRNIKTVLETVDAQNTLIVVSAMGKTTNAMEQVVKMYFEDRNGVHASLQEVLDFHLKILQDLFPEKQHSIYEKVKLLLEEVKGFLAWNKSPKHAYVYDQVVGYGELLSTTIVSTFLNEQGFTNTWLDARDCIKTGSQYRDAKIDWEQTQQEVNKHIKPNHNYITQGFIGSNENNFTTSLGREGSDYSAAIFAYCLNANSTTIWKDVPGVLNADPRYFEETQLLETISYREAIELSFYGASVIHPKTLQPLQRKEIPLYVKSFVHPQNGGTKISREDNNTTSIPCFILKKNQVLLKLSTRDFSFIMEDNLSQIFQLLHEHRMKMELIQNSAISTSICLDNRFNGLQVLLKKLEANFKVKCYEDVDLYTIRNFNGEAIRQLRENKDVLLEQRSQETFQLISK
ncbi:MAG: aspartate kinase [Flavobacteriaceae bacterium]|nr:aspartate kinase [Flavobacteriaceae bacterium]